MRKLILSLAATPLILGSMAVSAQAADDGFNVFSDVKFKGELRPRYQFTDDKAKSDAGQGSGSSITNRTNLNFSAKLFEVDGFNGTMELNAVNDFGSQQGADQNGGEALVAKISQANISYTVGGVTGIAGRKTVNLDNQRFIGSVGWKQNFQTLDLAAVAYGTGDFNILAAYVYGVNAIGDDGYNYGQDKYYGNLNLDPARNGGAPKLVLSGRTNSVALNASYKFMDPLKLTGYVYMLGSASDTYGLAATGKFKAGDSTTMNYRAEFAMQNAATLTTVADGTLPDNSALGSATYYNLDFGANISGFLLGLNYEVLGGDDDLTNHDSTQFQTPLATKHKFNGWADEFLITPESGLTDLNVRAGYKFESAGKIIGVYHMFGADKDGVAVRNVSAGDSYGSEFDIAYSVKLPGVTGVNALIKGAMYMDDDSNLGTLGDRTLAWVQLDYKFSVK